MERVNYPLEFEPIFKERIWGGQKLKTVLNKEIPAGNIGESWELSGVTGDVSVVKNGFYSGKTLNEIIELDGEGVLGKKVFAEFGKQFPLLFKFLDAREDLSIQVHPNDALAKERHNSFGKTEMWYVMQADAGAKLIVGFKENSTPEEYMEYLNKGKVLDLLDQKEVTKGDVFFLETGTVHAIGAGMVIAEIQQTSDITYRLYDFDRRDAAGNLRELHVDLALDAINYNKVETKSEYEQKTNALSNTVSCKYFRTDILALDGEMLRAQNGESFVVKMCVSGSFELEYEGETYRYETGSTVLLPSNMKEYILRGKAEILEVTID